MDAIVGLLFIAALVGLPIYAVIAARKGEVLGFEAAAPPDEILMTTVGQVGVARGWATASQSSKNVALTYVRSPNILIAFVLFISCFGALFAFAYWAIVSKKESLNISVSEVANGKTRVQIVSNGWKGKRSGQAIRDALGVAGGVPMAGMVVQDTAISPPTIGLPVVDEAPAIDVNEATPVPPSPTVPAGWYDDPKGSELRRYWDGTRWTKDYRAR